MSRLRSLLTGGACIALTGCALINSEQPNVSAQPPADTQQTGAVLLLQEAQQLEQQKKFEDAAALYSQIIEKPSAPNEAYEQLIRTQLELNRFDDAEKTASLFRERFPEAISPLLLQATVFDRQKKLAEAELIYRKGSERFPKSEEMLLGLGLALARQERIDETCTLLDRKLAESDEWSAALYSFRAQIELMTKVEGEESKAQSVHHAITLLNTATDKAPDNAELWLRKSELERALKDFPAATQSLETLQQLRPGNPQIAQALLSLYLQQGQYDNTMQQLSLLISLQHEEAAELIGLATRHALATGNTETAIKISKEGSQLLPKNIDVQFLNGYTLVLNKNFAEAEAALAATREKLYTEQPNSFDPRLELYYGIALLQQQKSTAAADIFTELAAQQFDSSIADYLQLLFSWRDTETLDLLADVLDKAELEITDSAYLPYFRALILQQRNEHQSAIQAFSAAEEKSVTLGEKQDDFLSDNFYYHFASSHEQCGQIDEAAKLFRKTLGLNPKRADAMNHLAYMWAEHNIHLDEAQELITKALEMEPKIGAFIDTLGWVYYQQGKYGQAMNQLSKAAELEPQDPTVHDHLGDCAMKLGRPQEARKHWLKSLEIEANEKIQAKADAIPTE